MKKLSLLLGGIVSIGWMKAQITTTLLTSASCFSPCTGGATINVGWGVTAI